MKYISTTKNKHISILLTLILLSTFYLPTLFAQVPLPEGAKARLGKGRILDLKYSPDGRQLVVATSIGIWIYDATTYQELDLLTKHEIPIERMTLSPNSSFIVLSPNGSFLASRDQKNVIHLWDMVTRTHKYKLAYQDNVLHIAFSADEKTFFTVASGGKICSWHTDTGNKKHDFKETPEMTDRVFRLAFNPDGFILATGNRDSTVSLWMRHQANANIHLRDMKTLF
ncbi:MAG: hypothetical protein OXM61_05370 [Candidatus Poribacteria bacterium]|nr:hypothetical protein [Candidatus Poribacteria bacterium]